MLGFLVITAVLLTFQWKVADLRNVVPTLRWTTNEQIELLTPNWNKALDQIARDAEAKGQANVVALSRGLKDALATQDRKAIETAAGEARRDRIAHGPRRARRGNPQPCGGVDRQGVHARQSAEGRHCGPRLRDRRRARHRAGRLARAAVPARASGRIRAWRSCARFLAGNGLFVDWGIEYVIFALGLGLLISNTVGTPEWLKPAVQTEFFVKTGLVILGASLIFSEVLQAGALGITQAVLVVFVVWYSCFWLARKLKVDDEFAAMLSTAVSICGVSAAIAACGAIKGDKKKLSYVTSLVLIVAVPMMIAMPWIAKSTGMNDLVAGAWLGGTLDTSASVVAAGALISDAAMKTGVIVKFSQNALIGVAAFALAIWWALRQGAQTGERPSAAVIWERFPKFVIGFVIASAIFSFLLPAEIVSGTRSALNDIRTWWFALAFVCVGLETRFVDLLTTDRGRPALAFLGAQTINVFWTLLLAWLLFGGVIFAQPAIN